MLFLEKKLLERRGGEVGGTANKRGGWEEGLRMALGSKGMAGEALSGGGGPRSEPLPPARTQAW